MDSREAQAVPILRSFGQITPRLAASAWVAPGAVVVGDVEIGDDSSIWYAAVVRGDSDRGLPGRRDPLHERAWGDLRCPHHEALLRT